MDEQGHNRQRLLVNQGLLSILFLIYWMGPACSDLPKQKLLIRQLTAAKESGTPKALRRSSEGPFSRAGSIRASIPSIFHGWGSRFQQAPLPHESSQDFNTSTFGLAQDEWQPPKTCVFIRLVLRQRNKGTLRHRYTHSGNHPPLDGV